jgi:exosortase
MTLQVGSSLVFQIAEQLMNSRHFLIAFSLCSILIGWGYWSTILKTSERWSSDPQYSHGYLMPLFSIYLLYRGRSVLESGPLTPSWWAVVPFVIAWAMRMGEASFFYNGLDQLSLSFMFIAMSLALGGRVAARWSWVASAFLIFSVPLPYRLQTFLAGQLQGVATQISTSLLVILGVPAISEGNIIIVENIRVGVVEACSGLGMMMMFAALAAGYGLLSSVPSWVKVSILALALPTAVVANVLRITATAVLLRFNQSDAAKVVFHDLAGWIMISLGCFMIILESWVLTRILLAKEPVGQNSPLGLRTKSK